MVWLSGEMENIFIFKFIIIIFIIFDMIHCTLKSLQMFF